MLWLRVSAGLIALCMVSPAGAGSLPQDLTTFGECIQEREQPRVEEISRAVYRDDAWVPAAAPPTLAPGFPGVDQATGGKSPPPPVGQTKI
jgi:hypothetical protein